MLHGKVAYFGCPSLNAAQVTTEGVCKGEWRGTIESLQCGVTRSSWLKLLQISASAGERGCMAAGMKLRV